MSDQSFPTVPGSLQPSPEEFLNLASKYPVVPVWREMMGDLETPVAAFAKLVGEGSGFLLESVERHHGRPRKRVRRAVRRLHEQATS